MTRPGEEILLRQFQQACIDESAGIDSGDDELINSSVDQINSIVKELWEIGGKTKKALTNMAQLANDRDPRIAVTAAAYTVNLFPESASVLKRLKKDDSILGLKARYALQNWEEGRGIMKTLLGLE